MSDKNAKPPTQSLESLNPADHLNEMAGTNYCNFCGKGENEYEMLFRGPGVQICDDCVETLSEEITLRRQEKDQP